MQQEARKMRGWRQWTGRVLPVIAVALLAIGPAHSKDKKKKKEAQATEQVERAQQAEREQGERALPVPMPGEAPQLVGKRSKDPPTLQNMREPSRAEAPRAEPRASVSIDRVIDQLERRYKAKVIKSGSKRSGDRQVYELRLDNGKRVWTVRVDAETGEEI